MLNVDFEGVGVRELADPSFNNWVHHVQHILPQVSEDDDSSRGQVRGKDGGGACTVPNKGSLSPTVLSILLRLFIQGRCLWKNPVEKPEEDFEEEDEEEEREDVEEAKPEVGPPLLNPVVEDERKLHPTQTASPPPPPPPPWRSESQSEQFEFHWSHCTPGCQSDRQE